MKSHGRAWKSYTCQDRFIGFFLPKLIFLEQPLTSQPAGRRCQPPFVTPAHKPLQAVLQFHRYPPQVNPGTGETSPGRTRSGSSSRVTKWIAALRCWFYGSHSSRRPSQKAQRENQSAKCIWLRCSPAMALLPCLRNTQGACITSLGSKATAQLICNYGTSWWPKAPCCVIWASQCLWQ